jgi:hypothetical protein
MQADQPHQLPPDSSTTAHQQQGSATDCSAEAWCTPALCPGHLTAHVTHAYAKSTCNSPTNHYQEPSREHLEVASHHAAMQTGRCCGALLLPDHIQNPCQAACHSLYPDQEPLPSPVCCCNAATYCTQGVARVALLCFFVVFLLLYLC